MGAARQKWQRHVSAWRHSGLTARDYAARAGVNAQTLKWWKWNLGKLASGELVLEFAEVISDPPEGVERQEDEPAFAIFLSVGDYELAIGKQFEASTLHRLLDVLEERL